jgi:hypothetical protein
MACLYRGEGRTGRAGCPLLSSLSLAGSFPNTLQCHGGCVPGHPITSLNTHVRPLSSWWCRFPSTPVTCTAALAGFVASAAHPFFPPSWGALLPLPVPLSQPFPIPSPLQIPSTQVNKRLTMTTSRIRLPLSGTGTTSTTRTFQTQVSNIGYRSKC